MESYQTSEERQPKQCEHNASIMQAKLGRFRDIQGMSVDSLGFVNWARRWCATVESGSGRLFQSSATSMVPHEAHPPTEVTEPPEHTWRWIRRFNSEVIGVDEIVTGEGWERGTRQTYMEKICLRIQPNTHKHGWPEHLAMMTRDAWKFPRCIKVFRLQR